jgi:prephenate dehydrogenase
MIITVVGLGLIGGSIALDLSSQINVTVHGVDNSLEHQLQGLSFGLVQKITSLDVALAESKIIILAIPVDYIQEILPSILDNIGDDVTVIDVGSTKADICYMVRNHPHRSRFVAAHPLAGTEFSGPKAALRGLFNGKKNIICESDLSAADALAVAVSLFHSLGMTTTYLSADEHDKHLAYVSHLSHVSSFMLGLTVLDIEKDEKQIFDLASTGFESTVRLAKSNPKTWSAIFSKNKDHLVEALDQYIDHLQNFKQLIAANDIGAMENLMNHSNEIKRILKS